MTAQTTAQRQAALRARQAILGLSEVRGIYLPPSQHAALKSAARQMLRKASKSRIEGS